MLLRVVSLALVMVLAGCASNPMVVSSNQALQTPDNDTSQVVFLRSSFVGSAINGSLYDVTDGEIKFIGVIANGTKVPYETTPGKHTFMVVSEAADFLEAEVEPGKNYFSLVTPRMGMWKARFSLWPIKADPNAEHSSASEEFQKWLANTKMVENTEKSKAWYEANKSSVQAKYNEYWPVWNQKTEAQVEKRSLSPEDGL